MRIAIASDLHFGYDWNGKRQEDSFEAAMGVVEKASKADVLILAGDIFDMKVPKQEVFARAIKIFREMKIRKSEARIVEVRKRDPDRKPNPLAMTGFPIIAIYGTHERRTKGSVNPVELLEEAGYLICLHGDVAIVEKNGERVAVHGISGVPEIYAREVFRELRPKPLEGMKNILMFHQSVKGFVYMDDDNPTLTLEDLPKGFDLIVDGHIHWANETRIGNTLFLIPGSTTTTQVRKTEAAIPKYIYFYDTETGKLEKEKLESVRKAFYIEMDASGKTGKEIKEAVISAITKKLEEVKDAGKPPLIRVVVTGVVNENIKAMGLEEVVRMFENQAIVTIAKKLITKDEIQKREKFLDAIKDSESVESIFVKIMEKKLRDSKLPIEFIELVEILGEGKLEEAERLIKSMKVDNELKDSKKSNHETNEDDSDSLSTEDSVDNNENDTNNKIKSEKSGKLSGTLADFMKSP